MALTVDQSPPIPFLSDKTNDRFRTTNFWHRRAECARARSLARTHARMQNHLHVFETIRALLLMYTTACTPDHSTYARTTRVKRKGGTTNRADWICRSSSTLSSSLGTGTATLIFSSIRAARPHCYRPTYTRTLSSTRTFHLIFLLPGVDIPTIHSVSSNVAVSSEIDLCVTDRWAIRRFHVF